MKKLGNESFVFLLELLFGLLFECMTFNFIIYVAQIVFWGGHIFALNMMTFFSQSTALVQEIGDKIWRHHPVQKFTPEFGWAWREAVTVLLS